MSTDQADHQTIERQAHVIYPHKALLFDNLTRSHILAPLFVVAVMGAVALFVQFEQVPPILLALHPQLIACGIALIAFIYFAVLVVLQVFAFSRIRYVFSPLGIRVEGGINFHSDLIAWIQINDVNISASVVEQAFKCGTIIIGTYKFGPQFLRFVPNFKELRAYLEAQLEKNLNNSRTINTI